MWTNLGDLRDDLGDWRDVLGDQGEDLGDHKNGLGDRREYLNYTQVDMPQMEKHKGNKLAEAHPAARRA